VWNYLGNPIDKMRLRGRFPPQGQVFASTQVLDDPRHGDMDDPKPRHSQTPSRWKEIILIFFLRINKNQGFIGIPLHVITCIKPDMLILAPILSSKSCKSNHELQATWNHLEPLFRWVIAKHLTLRWTCGVQWCMLSELEFMWLKIRHSEQNPLGSGFRAGSLDGFMGKSNGSHCFCHTSLGVGEDAGAKTLMVEDYK
jgi:hypothetical protein